MVVLQLGALAYTAEFELAETPEQVMNACAKQVQGYKQLEEQSKQRVKIGVLPPAEEKVASYWRLGAEIELLRAKRFFKEREEK